MIELPASVAPWRASLELLARDLALTLAPLVDRVALALGPLPSSSASGAGEPDGYYGLGRRGSYERLVVSEWLLADEFPDEFARRATAGEHLFVERATRLPQGGRRSIALFDGGPRQLGAPRVAHLALLIALYHRAHSGQARFGWGLLQAPRAPLVDGVTEASVRALLVGRSLADGSDDDLQTWRQTLGPLAAHDELWLIGDDALAPLHERTIGVRDPLTDARQLAITLRRRQRPPTTVTLDLPSDADCARLLRDPFLRGAGGRLPATGSSAPVVTNPVFSPDGRRVMVTLADGKLAILHVGNSPRTPVGKPVYFQPLPGEVVVAAGQENGRTVVITLDGKQRTVVRSLLGKRGGETRVRRVDVPEAAPLPSPTKQARFPALGRCIGRSKTTRDEPDVIAFTDGSQRLFTLDDGGLGAGPYIDALGLFDGVPLYLDRDRSGDDRGEHARLFYWTKNGYLGDGPRFGYEAGHDDDRPGFLLGVERSAGLAAIYRKDAWLLLSLRARSAAEATVIAPPARGRVIGFLLAGTMVVLDDDQRTISLVSRDRARILTTSDSEIVHAALSDRTQTLAYVTKSGALVVIMTRDGAELVRQQPASKP